MYWDVTHTHIYNECHITFNSWIQFMLTNAFDIIQLLIILDEGAP